MNYAFLIDNRKCIGCHACSTACKSENEVPIGVNRTWVKYVEKGDVSRHAPLLPGHALQPLRKPALRPDLSDEGDVPAATTGSSSSTRTSASAARRACRPVRTTRSTSTRTPAPRPSATSARTAPTWDSSRPASSCARSTRSSPATWRTRAPRSPALLAAHPSACGSPSRRPAPSSSTSTRSRRRSSRLAAAQDSGMLWAQWPGEGKRKRQRSDDWRGPIQIAPGKMAGALLRGGIGGPQVPRREPRTTSRTAFRGTGRCRPTSSPRRSARARSSSPRRASRSGFFPRRPLFTTIAAFLALLFIATHDRPSRLGPRPARALLDDPGPAAVAFLAGARRGGSSSLSPVAAGVVLARSLRPAFPVSPDAFSGRESCSPLSPPSTPRFSSRRPRAATSGRARCSPGTCSCRPSWRGPPALARGPLLRAPAGSGARSGLDARCRASPSTCC